jgi:hypothetical protein
MDLTAVKEAMMGRKRMMMGGMLISMIRIIKYLAVWSM